MPVDTIDPVSSGVLTSGDSLVFSWTNPTLDVNGNPMTITEHQLLWRKNDPLEDVSDPAQETAIVIAAGEESYTIADVTSIVTGSDSVYFSLRTFNSSGGNNGTDQKWVTVSAAPQTAGNVNVAINP